MTPLRLDFAPHTLRRAIVQTGLFAWLFGFVGLVLCIVAVVISLTLIKKNNAQKVSLRQVQAQLVENTKRYPPAKKIMIPEAQALAINNAILQLNLPWSEVFDALEEATPATIGLLSVEPDAKKHLIKGMAEAKSSGEMIAYIELLKKQSFFDSVVLTKHEINEQDANKPLRFLFEAKWKEGVY